MDLTKIEEVKKKLQGTTKKKKAVTVGIIVLCILLVTVYIVTRKEPPPPKMHVAVMVEKAFVKEVPVQLREIGTVEGYRSVPIYARVTGQLVKIHFREGQDVKKDQPLFTIDPAQYREKVRKADAGLAQSAAQMRFSRDEAKRYKYLFDKGAVSLSDYENKQAIADANNALVAADRASLENARLDLAHCFITAPFDGRMGAYSVFEGRIIKDTDTQLALINQVAPVYVAFSMPEKDLPDIRKYSALGTLKVTATPGGYGGVPPEGELTFIDNTVNVQTGTILLKATFPNTDKFLWPGQFVNVIMTLDVERNVVVVPERAIQLSQTGKYTFVIKPDNTAEYRIVETDRTVDGLTVVTKGVNAGETVVTDGHFKLRDGFPVEVKSAPAATGEGIPKGNPAETGDTRDNGPTGPKTAEPPGTKK